MRKLGPKELKLTGFLEQLGPLRTDKLATCMGMDINEVCAYARNLRDEGFIFFDKTEQRYGIWTLAPNGKMALCNHRNSPKEMARRAAELDKGSYILWCPTSDKPPRVVHDTYSKAVEVAEYMAKTHKGQQFIVCKQIESHQLVLQEVQRVERIWTKEKKAC